MIDYTNKFRVNFINYIYLLLSFIIIYIFIFIINKKNESIGELKKVISEKTEELIQDQKKILREFSEISDIEKLHQWNTIHEKEFRKNGFNFFLYQKDSLVFWSGTQVQVSQYYDSLCLANGFAPLSNGFYWIEKVIQNKNIWVSISLIKGNYPYQNKFVNNSFSDIYNLDDVGVFSKNKGKDSFRFGNTQFFFNVLNQSSVSGKLEILQLLLFVFIWYFFLLSLFYLIKWLLPLVINWDYILFLFLAILLRFLVMFFDMPMTISENQYFSPVYYASSAFIPSLGDLILHITTLVAISYLFFKQTSDSIKCLKWQKSVINISLSIIIVIVLVGFQLFLKSLVIDSSINLDLADIFLIHTQTLIAYFLIAFFVLSIFHFITQYFFLITNAIVNKTIGYIVVVWVFVLACFYFIHWIDLFYSVSILIFLLISIFFYSKIDFRKKVKVRWIIYVVVSFALFSYLIIQTESKYKELENRKLIIQKVASENDPIAEYLLKNISKEIEKDNILKGMLSQILVNEDSVRQYLQTNYFSGYWDKYRVQMTFCKSFETLLIAPDNLNIDCDEYFQSLKSKMGKSTSVRNLWHLDYKNGYNSFLATFKINSKYPTSIYIELDSKYNYGELGYPELLIDSKSGINTELATYSQSVYYNDNLIKASGKFFYPLVYFGPDVQNGQIVEYKAIDYSHLIYRVNNQIYVLSKKESSLFVASGFSYILALFVLFSLLYWIVVMFPNFKLKQTRFRSKVQIAIISILFLSFIVTGVVSFFYIRSIYQKKNVEILREKAQSILTEFQNNTSSIDIRNLQNSRYLSDLLSKLSNIFFTDINLYDNSGNLITSSRSQIFNEGLLSVLMDPDAYYTLGFLNSSLLIQKEQIGQQQFMSAYIPVRDQMGTKLGFIHLPYFARQSELNREISIFISTYINIYLILIVISILLALSISSRLTKPLLFIQQGISKLRLGKKNEKIEWNSNDELGNLIKEYNRMIDELDVSAQRLASSEREGAWREMAKQVAHEIKNPLTPIKLGAQYLQKAWDDKVSDFDERMKKFTQTLSEQVETLSAIASEFSAFAQMPQPEFTQIDLFETLLSVITLFQSTKNVQIELFPKEKIEVEILADKKQLQRLFVNLIQNSIQAIPDGKPGMINITLKLNEDYVTVRIQDNGNGIPDELKDKIFLPNFTTKSTGMGLGLAMVKSSIIQMGGRISFESEVMVGTEFIIDFPWVS